MFIIHVIHLNKYCLNQLPQRRQGSDPRPLWLFVGTPSAFGPQLKYRERVAQPALMGATRYFWYTIMLLP